VTWLLSVWGSRSKIGFGRVTCTFSRTSSGSHVLVNQTAEHEFSADLASLEFCHSDARRVVLAVGDALGDALQGAIITPMTSDLRFLNQP
jgi:hypothetical protein